MAFKFKVVAEAEAAKRTSGRFTPKYPELDQQMLEWFLDQREQGEYSSLHAKSEIIQNSRL